MNQFLLSVIAAFCISFFLDYHRVTAQDNGEDSSQPSRKNGLKASSNHFRYEAPKSLKAEQVPFQGSYWTPSQSQTRHQEDTIWTDSQPKESEIRTLFFRNFLNELPEILRAASGSELTWHERLSGALSNEGLLSTVMGFRSAEPKKEIIKGTSIDAETQNTEIFSMASNLNELLQMKPDLLNDYFNFIQTLTGGRLGNQYGLNDSTYAGRFQNIVRSLCQGFIEQLENLSSMQPHLFGLFRHFTNPSALPTLGTLSTLLNEIPMMPRNDRFSVPRPFHALVTTPLELKLALANSFLAFLDTVFPATVYTRNGHHLSASLTADVEFGRQTPPPLSTSTVTPLPPLSTSTVTPAPPLSTTSTLSPTDEPQNEPGFFAFGGPVIPLEYRNPLPWLLNRARFSTIHPTQILSSLTTQAPPILDLVEPPELVKTDIPYSPSIQPTESTHLLPQVDFTSFDTSIAGLPTVTIQPPNDWPAPGEPAPNC